jgi:hypothetical protein
MNEQHQVAAACEEETDRTGRREALKEMGKYAAYTALVLTALTLPVDAAAKSRRRRGKGNPRAHSSGR